MYLTSVLKYDAYYFRHERTRSSVKTMALPQEETVPLDAALIYFDLETTDCITRTADIIQLAAKHDERTFNAYVLPRSDINPYAAKVNGFSKKDGQLFKNGVVVETMELEDALRDFIEFLKETDKHVVLVAHFGFRFDAPLLLRELAFFGLMDSFVECVDGFADTFVIFSNKMPSRTRSLKLVDLAKEYGIDAVDAHDGAEDVRILRDVTVRAGFKDEDILKELQTVTSVIKGGWTQFGKPYGLEVIRRSISNNLFESLASNFVTMDMLQRGVSDNITFPKFLEFLDKTEEKLVEKLKIAVLRSMPGVRR